MNLHHRKGTGLPAIAARIDPGAVVKPLAHTVISRGDGLGVLYDNAIHRGEVCGEIDAVKGPWTGSIACLLVRAASDGVDGSVWTNIKLVHKRVPDISCQEIGADPKAGDGISWGQINGILDDLDRGVPNNRGVPNGCSDIIGFRAGEDAVKAEDQGTGDQETLHDF